MSYGIGIDLVEIARFKDWHTKSMQSLQRLFSAKEIAYCKTVPSLRAARFATHFALREAAYKAWSSAYPDKEVTFLAFCKALQVDHHANGSLKIALDETRLGLPESVSHLHASLTHSQITAGAVVILNKSK